MDITICADDLIHIPPFSFTAEIRVIVREKARHQLLASGDDAIGVDSTGVGVFALVIWAYMILDVDSHLSISGSRTFRKRERTARAASEP
jgi:hypothetical protein